VVDEMIERQTADRHGQTVHVAEIGPDDAPG
jgi:hypothetical protein